MVSDKKAKAGVVATVSRESGKIRLVLTDVKSEPGGTSWTVQRPYTHVELDAAAFQSGQLSENDLANIGLSIVTRLSALAKA